MRRQAISKPARDLIGKAACAGAHDETHGLVREALSAGADGLMHGIVDKAVDAEFIDLMKRNHATYVPTLSLYVTLNL